MSLFQWLWFIFDVSLLMWILYPWHQISDLFLFLHAWDLCIKICQTNLLVKLSFYLIFKWVIGLYSQMTWVILMIWSWHHIVITKSTLYLPSQILCYISPSMKDYSPEQLVEVSNCKASLICEIHSTTTVSNNGWS